MAAIVSILVTCCSTENFKLKPEHKGVDPALQPLVGEYMWLSAQNNILFKNNVTIGFKHLSGTAVGMCTWGGWFREIDIDPTYWKLTGNRTHIALLFHELTHCYCGRGHDYADGVKYPRTADARLKQAIDWMVKGGERPGFWDDGCPTSLMFPVVVDDTCVQEHYEEYTTEIFNRCKPGRDGMLFL